MGDNIYSKMYDHAQSMGFRFHEEYVKEFDANNTEKGTIIELNAFLNKILDTDLRKQPFVLPYFPSDQLHTLTEPKLTGSSVVQITSIINVSESLKRQHKGDTLPQSVFRIQITDGHNKITCISTQSIPNLTVETPPGTKFLYSGGIVLNGYVFLNSHNFKYLGGRVSYLYEAYIANRNAQRLRLAKGITIQKTKSASSSSKSSSSSSLSSPPVFEPLPTAATKSSSILTSLSLKESKSSTKTKVTAISSLSNLPPPPPSQTVIANSQSLSSTHRHSKVNIDSSDDMTESMNEMSLSATQSVGVVAATPSGGRGRGGRSSGRLISNSSGRVQQPSSSYRQNNEPNHSTPISIDHSSSVTYDDKGRGRGRRGGRSTGGRDDNVESYERGSSNEQNRGSGRGRGRSGSNSNRGRYDDEKVIKTDETDINQPVLTTMNFPTLIPTAAATTKKVPVAATTPSVIESVYETPPDSTSLFSYVKNNTTTTTVNKSNNNHRNITPSSSSSSSVIANGEHGDNKPWMCKECTFNNDSGLTYCEMCELPRKH